MQLCPYFGFVDLAIYFRKVSLLLKVCLELLQILSRFNLDGIVYFSEFGFCSYGTPSL